MIDLIEQEIETVSGGIVIAIPFAVKAAAGFIGSTFAAYQAGKVIGSDIIQGINNSNE
ncbi:hypothetical protein [Arsukibacterium sp.]|uniref:hypothetical protein n=1 Tax=Arsukibacterium sp. TaxID=1977258 RepID=UPI002FD8CEA9